LVDLQLRWEWKSTVAEPLKLAAETVANLTALATAHLDDDDADDSDDAAMQDSDCDDDMMLDDSSAAAAAADAQGDEHGATPLLMVSNAYVVSTLIATHSTSSCVQQLLLCS
jgi:hypothetical protein